MMNRKKALIATVVVTASCTTFYMGAYAQQPKNDGKYVESKGIPRDSIIGDRKVSLASNNVIIVKVKFRVGKNGAAIDPKIVESAGAEYDEQALAVVREVKNWIADKHKKAGEIVVVPVTFQEAFSIPK